MAQDFHRFQQDHLRRAIGKAMQQIARCHALVAQTHVLIARSRAAHAEQDTQLARLCRRHGLRSRRPPPDDFLQR